MKTNNKSNSQSSSRQRRNKRHHKAAADPEGLVASTEIKEDVFSHHQKEKEDDKETNNNTNSNIIIIEETELFTDTFSFFMTARYPCEKRTKTKKKKDDNRTTKIININEEGSSGESIIITPNEEEEDDDDNDEEKRSSMKMKKMKMMGRNEKKLFTIDSDKFYMPFFVGLIIVGLQMFIYIVVFLSTINVGQPPNADILMRLAQASALFVAMYTQSDLVDAVFMLTEGSKSFPDITTPFKFATSNLMRFIAGNLGIISSFVLVIYSPGVVDLLLNFTAIEFVATLDDSAFRLASKGFLGINLEKKAKEIQDYRYEHHIRKKARLFRFMIYIIYFVVYTASFVAIIVLQSKRYIGVDNEVYVQLDDTNVPDLFGISGAYIGCRGFLTRRNSKTYTETIGYVDASYHGNCPELLTTTMATTGDDEVILFPANSFFFCTDTGTDEEGWVFIKEETKDPCLKSNYVLRSLLDNGENKPSDSFDILTHANAKWLVQQSETGGETFLDSVFIESVQSFMITYNCTYRLQYVASIDDEWGTTVRTLALPLPRSDYPIFKGRFGQASQEEDRSFYEEFSLVYRQAFLRKISSETALEPGTRPGCDIRGSDDIIWSLVMYDGLRWHYMDRFDVQMFVDFAKKRFKDANEEPEESQCGFKMFLKYYLRDKSWMLNETISWPTMISDPMKFLTPGDTGGPTNNLRWYETDITYSRGLVRPGRPLIEKGLQYPKFTLTDIELSCVKRGIECGTNEFPFSLDLTTGRFPKEMAVLLQHNPPSNNSLKDYGYNYDQYFMDYAASLGGWFFPQLPNSEKVPVAENYQSFSISEWQSKDFRFRDGETRYRLETCVPFEAGSNFCMGLRVLNTEATASNGLVEFDIGFDEMYRRIRNRNFANCIEFLLCYYDVNPSDLPGEVPEGYQTQTIIDQSSTGVECSLEAIEALYPEIKTQVGF